MRAVVQRVSQSSVEVEGQIVAAIGPGILVLVGFQATDKEQDDQYLIDKILNLRIFEDFEGKMNRSVTDVHGGVLLVPNFTLYGDARRGRRPSYSDSSSPETARRQFDSFCSRLRLAFPSLQTGVFQTEMSVSLINDGPVTILLDSERKF